MPPRYAVVRLIEGTPVAGTYVKVYITHTKDSGGDGTAAAVFHKDGYTDRRGLMDFWTITIKPEKRVCVKMGVMNGAERGVGGNQVRGEAE